MLASKWEVENRLGHQVHASYALLDYSSLLMMMIHTVMCKYKNGRHKSLNNIWDFSYMNLVAKTAYFLRYLLDAMAETDPWKSHISLDEKKFTSAAIPQHFCNELVLYKMCKGMHSVQSHSVMCNILGEMAKLLSIEKCPKKSLGCQLCQLFWDLSKESSSDYIYWIWEMIYRAWD